MGIQHHRVLVRIAHVLAIVMATVMGSDSVTVSATTNLLGPLPGWVTQTEPRADGPIALPGRFKAIDYRAGGEGVGYSDISTMNIGGEYRDDAVDIQTAHDTTSAYNVGWIGAGEWLAYEVEVGESGDYIFSVRVATIYDCRSFQGFHIELDGADVTGPIAVPNTGGWQRWADAVSRPVSIPAGSYTLKIVAETAGFNVNYVEMSEASSTTREVIALPGQFEAEDYRAGGPDVGFHDTTENNHCGAYRGDDVDIQICDDSQGPCYNVGWVKDGEWLAYDVQVETPGDYTFTMRTAAIYDGRSLHIELDGTNVTGSTILSNTGGWHDWTDVTSNPVNLAAGSYTLKIMAETGPFNLNHIQVRAVDEPSISTAPQASLTHLFP